MKNIIPERLQESIKVKQSLITDEMVQANIMKLAQTIVECLMNGGKIVLCGNGGSASDALHFAGEIVGRFQRERTPWPAVVLNADVATLTAIANDYGYDEVFARQTQAYLDPKDILIGISTSGNSENILRAVKAGNKIGGVTAALLGRDGGRIAKLADIPIIVHSQTTARIQESHIAIIHILCEMVEDALSEEADE